MPSGAKSPSGGPESDPNRLKSGLAALSRPWDLQDDAPAGPPEKASTFE